MSIAAETALLNLTVPARAEPVPFLYFSSSKQHIFGILEGRTYPQLPDVGPVTTIVDIGANVGAASVMFAARHPGAAVHAFEPGPGPLELLRHNASHFPSITVHSFGLGIEDAEQRLYRSRWDPMSASVLPSSENTGLYDVIPVRRTRAALDAIGIARIDVLKIDTEGCEVPILAQLAPMLPSVKCVYLEFHSDRDRRLIDQHLVDTHLLAFASARHPHRGDVCYVNRDTPFSRRHEQLAIEQVA